MNCAECLELIPEKLEGMLPRELDHGLRRHLSGCARCRAELALHKEMLRGLKRPSDSGLGESFTARVAARTLSIAEREKRLKRVKVLFPVLLSAAAGILLLVFGGDLVQALGPHLATLPAVLDPTATLQGLQGIDAGLAERLSRIGRLPMLIAMITFFLAIAVWSLTKARSYLRT
jgi:anti-sigma factor RsiW